MIPSGITDALFVAAIALVGWLLKWGVQRIVDAQEDINQTLKEISGQLGHAINRVVQLETWVEQREVLDNERHNENKAAILLLQQEMNDRRKKR
jgi:hypothetical protein